MVRTMVNGKPVWIDTPTGDPVEPDHEDADAAIEAEPTGPTITRLRRLVSRYS